MLRLLLAMLLVASYGSAQPNIVILFSDDQRTDTIGAWGNPRIDTPNMDRLAREGFSFRNNYCMGSAGGAVCVPSRAMLNTGRAYFRIRMDMGGEATLGETLGAAGYQTFGTGKWHNGPDSWARSFQRGRNIFFGGMSDHTNVPLAELAEDGELRRTGSDRRFSSEIFAETLIEFLKTRDKEKPFFAYSAFTSPHDPRTPPARYRDRYYQRKLPLPANYMPQHPFNNGAMTGRDESLGPWPRTEELVRDQLAEYYGMVTHLDEQIGRILDVLDEQGLAENTYVVFAGDHGLAVGSHGLLGKQSVYEHSMKAPLIVRGPEVPAGGSSEALTYLLDLFPTLLNAAGQAPPNPVDGKDLAPIWNGDAESVRDTLFLSYGTSMRSVRDERYKLIRYPLVDLNQLFDLENDPDEMKNLADDGTQRSRVEQMMAWLVEWQESVGDLTPLQVPNPRRPEIDLTGHERSPDPWQPMWVIEKYFPDWF